jgi:rSAM/selenodomain-associated transferase 2
VNERPALSIIVPVRNEAEGIVPFLRHLREHAPDAEILVVDGESDDSTPDQVESVQAALRIRLIRSARGRACQMNAGAAASTGRALWFVHADSVLPENAVPELLQALEDRNVAGGCFRIRFAERDPVYRVSDTLGNVGVDLFRIALGDHGIFCRRSAFARIGGIPDLPLMEDAELYRRLREQGKIRQLRPEITTSARRYQQHGPYRTTLVHTAILALYVLRVPPARLLRLYRRWLRL